MNCHFAPRIRRRHCAPVVAFVVALLALAGGATPASAIDDEPVVREPRPLPDQSFTLDFGWELAPRYTDRTGDGFADPARTAAQVALPADWPVTLDACDWRTAVPSTVGYVWTLNGTTVRQTECRFTWKAPGQGTYPVSLTVEMANGNKAAVTKAITLNDLLIVALGDSLTSGEGNPIGKRDDGRPIWGYSDERDSNGHPVPSSEDARCHRSAHAGAARAASSIERYDPSTSVTFIHLACSGARVRDPNPGDNIPEGGLLDQYQGAEFQYGFPLDPQVGTLKRLVGSRQIDALVLSIGINDLDFLRIATRCVQISECWKEEATLVGSLDDPASPIGRLPGLYDELAARLLSMNIPPDRVFLNEYPDNTRKDGKDRDADEAFCESMLEDAKVPGTDIPVGAATLKIDQPEAKWASRVVIGGLTRAAEAAADKHGWRRIDHVADRFDWNGYCVADVPPRRFVRYQESEQNQGNPQGALHPNTDGHQVLRHRILAHVEGSFPAAPVLVVRGLAPGGQFLAGTIPEVTADDVAGLAGPIVTTLDGSAYVMGTPIGAPGAHVLTVSATSASGPTAALQIPFTVVQAAATQLTVSPASVIGGTGAKGTVTINGPAPSGGVKVSLSSTKPATASVPSSVVVRGGQNQATFSVTTSPVASDQSAALAAQVGASTRTTTLGVTAPRLDRLTLVYPTVEGGTATGATVSLTGPAPSSGVTVSLSTDKPAASVPATVVVPSGASLAHFDVTTREVTTSTTVTITASASGVIRTATLAVMRPVVERDPICLRCVE